MLERPLTPPRTEEDYFDYEPLPEHLRERDPDADRDDWLENL